MKYVGVHTQQVRNNRLSIMLLIMFPVILLFVVWLFIFLVSWLGGGYYDTEGNLVHSVDFDNVTATFLNAVPWVVGGVGI